MALEAPPGQEAASEGLRETGREESVDEQESKSGDFIYIYVKKILKN